MDISKLGDYTVEQWREFLKRYSQEETYNEDECVVYNYKVYKSKADDNVGHFPTEGSSDGWWEFIPVYTGERGTAITADSLAKIESGIKDAVDKLNELIESYNSVVNRYDAQKNSSGNDFLYNVNKIDGVLPVSKGGTNATDLDNVKVGKAKLADAFSVTPDLLINLSSNSSAKMIPSQSPNIRPGVDGVLSIENGGTGAKTAAKARENLGVDDEIKDKIDKAVNASSITRRKVVHIDAEDDINLEPANRMFAFLLFELSSVGRALYCRGTDKGIYIDPLDKDSTKPFTNLLAYTKIDKTPTKRGGGEEESSINYTYSDNRERPVIKYTRGNQTSGISIVIIDLYGNLTTNDGGGYVKV